MNLPLVNGPSGFEGPTRPVDFIRHGSTHLNDTDRAGDKIRGWADVPLDDRGLQEAKKVGAALAKMDAKPRVLFTSDLQRASTTAHIVSQITGIPVAPPTSGLRPWNLGHFQGEESSSIAPQLKMFLNNPGQRVPGGVSFTEFATRFVSTMRGLLAKTQLRMGIVSHHRNERFLSALDKTDWKGFDKSEFFKHGSPTGILITFEIPSNVSNRQGFQGGGRIPQRQGGL